MDLQQTQKAHLNQLNKIVFQLSRVNFLFTPVLSLKEVSDVICLFVPTPTFEKTHFSSQLLNFFPSANNEFVHQWLTEWAVETGFLRWSPSSAAC